MALWCWNRLRNEWHWAMSVRQRRRQHHDRYVKAMRDLKIEDWNSNLIEDWNSNLIKFFFLRGLLTSWLWFFWSRSHNTCNAKHDLFFFFFFFFPFLFFSNIRLFVEIMHWCNSVQFFWICCDWFSSFVGLFFVCVQKFLNKTRFAFCFVSFCNFSIQCNSNKQKSLLIIVVWLFLFLFIFFLFLLLFSV